MSDVRAAAAFALTASQKMLGRFVDDLSPRDWLHRVVTKANCAAWIVGHLILTDRRAMGRLNVANMPALPEGFETRFAHNDEASAADDFGDVSILRPLWNAHRQLLIETAKAMPLEQFDTPLDSPFPMFKTVGEMLLFFPIHTSLHVGQISTIRRSLGKPPLM